MLSGNGSYNHCSSPGLLSPGVSKNMQDKGLPAASLSRKPDLRTLMPPTNKCSPMPTVVSALSRSACLFLPLIP